MGIPTTAARASRLVWLAPVVGLVLVVTAYRVTYRDEAGLYAGAEPALAGAVVAAPFVALTIALAGCAVATAFDGSSRRRRGYLVAAALLTVVGLAGAFALLGS